MRKAPILLLADDETSILERLALELTSAGFEVIKAESGKSAYEICLRQHVDFIVSDINMPDLSGFTLLKKLRLIGKSEVPVIFITAYSSHEFDEGTDLQNVKVLSKPFDATLLIQKIQEVLEEVENAA